MSTPIAQLAAEASEAAGAQGSFWEMSEILLAHQGDLRLPRPDALRRRARARHGALHRRSCASGEYADRILADVASADESGVTGTPTFFINGRRHYGLYDLQTLTEAVTAAKRRAVAFSAA